MKTQGKTAPTRQKGGHLEEQPCPQPGLRLGLWDNKKQLPAVQIAPSVVLCGHYPGVNSRGSLGGGRSGTPE